jgi:hypothetical protein
VKTSPGTPVSSTNKTDRHDIAEILLKVALNNYVYKTEPFGYKYDICVQNRTIWFQNQYYYMNTANLFISNLESNDFRSYSIRISNIHGLCWRELIIYDSGLYI